MPKLKLNESGQLVDADGNILEIDGETVQVEDAKTQQQVDKVISERLARQSERIKALETQANKTPELEKLLEAMKAEKADLEGQMEAVKESAKAEAQTQLSKIQKERDTFQQKFENEAKARLQFEVRTSILGAAKDRFNDPSIDVVPHLLNTHLREEEKGADGKPTGRYLDFFKLRYKNDKDEDVEEALPVDKALEVWAREHPHHVRASERSGSGGGHYGPFIGNVKRSAMNNEQKANFIEEHGSDAFMALPA